MAGHLKLGRLIVLWDDNEISIDGKTDIATSTNQIARFKASGWQVARVDGHDIDAVSVAIEAAKKSRKPSLIACKTTIGFGAPNLAGSHKTHGAPLGAEEIQATRMPLGGHMVHLKYQRISDLNGNQSPVAGNRFVRNGSHGLM